LLACFICAPNLLFRGIQRLASSGFFFRWQLANAELRERSFAAQHVYTHLFQRV